jgi:hypothetical protein
MIAEGALFSNLLVGDDQSLNGFGHMGAGDCRDLSLQAFNQIGQR